MQKNPAAEEVIRRLNAYYDAEKAIDEELRTIEHAQEQRDRVSLRSPSLSGLPAVKGGTATRQRTLRPRRRHTCTTRTSRPHGRGSRSCGRTATGSPRRSPRFRGLTGGSWSSPTSARRSRSAGKVGSPGRRGTRWLRRWAYRKRMPASRPTGSFSSSRA